MVEAIAKAIEDGKKIIEKKSKIEERNNKEQTEIGKRNDDANQKEFIDLTTRHDDQSRVRNETGSRSASTFEKLDKVPSEQLTEVLNHPEPPPKEAEAQNTRAHNEIHAQRVESGLSEENFVMRLQKETRFGDTTDMPPLSDLISSFEGLSKDLVMVMQRFRESTARLPRNESNVGGTGVMPGTNEPRFGATQAMQSPKELDLAMPPLHSALTGHGSNYVNAFRRDLLDGRLISLNESQIEDILNGKRTLAARDGAQVFATSNKIPGFNIKMVIKKLHIDRDDLDTMRSITNARLASRILHYGIVPLIAFHDALHEDQSRTHGFFYFVSPYFEGGDLMTAIAEDTNALLRKETSRVRMSQRTRLKIINQVASAICYLHTPVGDFRHGVLHMNIKSSNIVLDMNNNARLINFGLEREMKEPDSQRFVTSSPLAGTVGYFPTTTCKGLTKFHDYHYFGTTIWKRHVWTPLLDLAQRCVESLIQHAAAKTFQISDMLKELDSLMRGVDERSWTRSPGLECEMCLVNQADEPGKEDNKMWCKVQNAFEKLNKQNLKTLIVVYSGNYGFQTRQKNAKIRNQSIDLPKSVTGSAIEDNVSLFKLSENELMKDVELSNEVQKLTTVDKIVLFDCYADIRSAFKGKTVVQFNSSTSMTSAVPVNIKKKESTYIGALIKALTASEGTKHELYEHTDCTRCKDIADTLFIGNFLTVNSLQTFIESYIEHTDMMIHREIPSVSVQNLSSIDAILAYRYQFPLVPVQVKIKTPKGVVGEIELTHLNYFDNVNQLREFLLRRILGNDESTKYLVIKEDQMTACAAAVSIGLETGTPENHLKEIKSLEQVTSAWKARIPLIAQLRNVSKIGFQNYDAADIVSPNDVEDIFKEVSSVPPDLCSHNPSEDEERFIVDANNLGRCVDKLEKRRGNEQGRLDKVFFDFYQSLDIIDSFLRNKHEDVSDVKVHIVFPKNNVEGVRKFWPFIYYHLE
ncbi:Y1105-like protein [Mya arenaria]|uniref:Y1105-like protein n=1 Tax=Mya arenaria TaxID=6604 RepID=A0ABY7DZ07_MYAAR|nr:Y1105-like protein [Mya arenaria]